MSTTLSLSGMIVDCHLATNDLTLVDVSEGWFFVEKRILDSIDHSLYDTRRQNTRRA